jgi:Nuclease-related domain/Viral (Superfamily 1) RNA helicase
MATLIPESLPDNASAGEKIVAARLQNLPEDVLVYYEPIIRRRYPDFVIVAPSIGVIVIEVKGIPLSWVTQADNQTIRFRQAGQYQEMLHPARQAREYQNRLMQECQGHPFWEELHTGKHFRFAFGHLVILTAITRQELADSPWAHLFPEHSAICKDELEKLAHDSDAWMNALRGCINPEIPVNALNNRQVGLVRSILHPETSRLPGIDLPAKGAPPADLKLLDLQQESAARSMGGGHRIIYGVPGSGKTIILIARARLLAEAGQRVLVLCYNKSLQAHIAAALKPYPLVQVSRFGAWAMGQGAPKNPDREQFGHELLSILQGGNGDAGAFDAVLIDEAQDFQHAWFRCAVLALKEPADGDLMICFDLNQNLYGAEPPVWSALGIHARGRTRRLTRNYRNTKQIAALAFSFCAPDAQSDDDRPASVALVPENCDREGPLPVLIQTPGRDAQVKRCNDIVSALIGGTFGASTGALRAAADDILVLAQSNHLVSQMSENLKPEHPRVSVSTIHDARGLQRRVIILLGAEDLGAVRDRSLLYVALTRPEDLLIVLHSHDTPLVREMVRNLEAAQSASPSVG